MLIKTCLTCKFHEIKQEGNEKMSRCIKENCYSEFSKCIAMRALNQFLEDEKPEPELSFSALDRFYSRE
jgi:hypothetical protein